jgi:hypothetical protein
MKYAVEMGSGSIIYVPSFIKIGSGIQNLNGGIHRNTDSMRTAGLLLFFKIKKVG